MDSHLFQTHQKIKVTYIASDIYLLTISAQTMLV